MKLRYAGGSPFVRKVTVSAIETGLDDRIERITTDHRDPNDALHGDNPLGKVPAMTLDDGTVLIESSIICAHLDTLHDGPRLIPEGGDARHEALFLEAVAGGMTDAAIAVQRERGRPEDKQWDAFSERQWKKVEQSMDVLETRVDQLGGPLTIGPIAVACALGWIEYRLGDKLGDWGERCPRLAAWYREFVKRPSMQATMPDYGR